MEIRGLDHVGLVVEQIDEALETWERLLGATLERRETLGEQGVEAAMLRVGNGRIELIAPVRDDTGVARFLESRGSGMHHLALEVDDIRATLEELDAAGARLVDTEPRKGFGGHEVAFVHPEAMHGVLVEVISRG